MVTAPARWIANGISPRLGILSSKRYEQSLRRLPRGKTFRYNQANVQDIPYTPVDFRGNPIIAGDKMLLRKAQIPSLIHPNLGRVRISNQFGSEMKPSNIDNRFGNGIDMTVQFGREPQSGNILMNVENSSNIRYYKSGTANGTYEAVSSSGTQQSPENIPVKIMTKPDGSNVAFLLFQSPDNHHYLLSGRVTKQGTTFDARLYDVADNHVNEIREMLNFDIPI